MRSAFLMLMGTAIGGCATLADETVTPPSAATATATAPTDLAVPRVSDDILGGWADGIDAEACATRQITYFSADGVVIDMYGQAGPFHSFGTWRRDDERLVLTHNEFPLPATGASSRDFPFTVVRLDADRLHLRNSKGELRERRRCPNAVLSDAAKTAEGP